LYSARSLNAANALKSQLHVKQKCIQFASEHVLPNVWCSEFSRKTVPRTRSLDGKTAVAVACQVVRATASRSESADRRRRQSTV